MTISNLCFTRFTLLTHVPGTFVARRKARRRDAG